MKYILTESQFETLMGANDRIIMMAIRYLDTVFENLNKVDTKFGSGYKFNDDRGYAVFVYDTEDGKQLAISSQFVSDAMPILNSLLDLDRKGIFEFISKYCREVLGMDFKYIRSWPIKIPEPEEPVISEVKKVEDFEW
jgi:hypothetical protein